MSDQAKEELLKRIEEYASEEAFAKIVADALALVPPDGLEAFKRDLGRRCGRVPPSTVDRWSRAASIPGEHVRRHILNQIRDLLNERRP